MVKYRVLRKKGTKIFQLKMFVLREEVQISNLFYSGRKGGARILLKSPQKRTENNNDRALVLMYKQKKIQKINKISYVKAPVIIGMVRKRKCFNFVNNCLNSRTLVIPVLVNVFGYFRILLHIF